jgi:Na+/H+ antiporter NhaD/arsenite permease-like protein
MLMHRDEDTIVSHSKGLLVKSLIVLVGVIILFSLQGITHVEVSIVAIGGGSSFTACHNKGTLRVNTA